MKILIAPNAFKGSLTAMQAAESIANGVLTVFPDAQITQLPIADGGDGTLETIMATADGQYIPVNAQNPLGEEIESRFGLLADNTAIVESAEASGIRLIRRDQLNPMYTTNYGTGQLIQAALDHNPQRVIIGVGGSAMVDGGTGMAKALGFKLLDKDGNDIAPGGTGLVALDCIVTGNPDPRITATEFIVACDVTNPLTGAEGAARIFGPQKGATPEMVEVLDNALSRYAEIIQRDLGKSVADLSGSGAAGGLAAGLVAFLDAKIASGIDVVLDTLNADQYLTDCDLVITGEGAIDAQTIYGKAPIGIARRAAAQGIPVIALAGMIAEDANIVYEHGITALMATENRPMSLDEAIHNAAPLLEQATSRALRLCRMGVQMRNSN